MKNKIRKNYNFDKKNYFPWSQKTKTPKKIQISVKFKK